MSALALGGGLDAAVAYLSVEQSALSGAGRLGPTSRRLLAVDVQSGAVLAATPLAGSVSSVILGAAADVTSPRLYAAETVTDIEHEPSSPTRSRLLVLDAVTLEAAVAIPLRYRPLALAVTPDGRYAYALVSSSCLLAESVLMRVDLATGMATLLPPLPGRAMGLVATTDRIYLASPETGAVWVVDLRRGRVVRTITVGRQPVAVVP